MSTNILQTIRNRLEDRPPLVTKENVGNHLHLLSAFLQFVHQGVAAFLELHPSSSRQEAYNSIVYRAIYRFQLWVDSIISQSGDNSKPISDQEIPPLDVAMTLHSLMLSPHRYYEDSLLRFPQLQRIGDYPLAHLISLLNFDGGGYDANKVQASADLWVKQTSLHYDPVESLRADQNRFVVCPFCEEAVSVPWKKDGNGFADKLFEQSCDKCGARINQDSLCVGKLLKGLRRVDKVPLPNTLDLRRGELRLCLKPALAISQAVLNELKKPGGKLPDTRGILALAASSRLSKGMEYVSTVLQDSKNVSRENVARVLLAFAHPYPFSQDPTVVLNVMVKFARTANSLRFLSTGNTPPSIEYNYDRGYSGYIDHLQRLASPEHHEGPPLHIDLIWHTHMLGASYRMDCLQLIGVYPNHVPYGEIEPTGFSNVMEVADYNIVEQYGKQVSLFKELARGHRAIGKSHPGEAKAREQMAKDYEEISGYIDKVARLWEDIKTQRPPHVNMEQSANYLLAEEGEALRRLPYGDLAKTHTEIALNLNSLDGVHACQD